jgi:hypothetical protein
MLFVLDLMLDFVLHVTCYGGLHGTGSIFVSPSEERRTDRGAVRRGALKCSQSS